MKQCISRASFEDNLDGDHGSEIEDERFVSGTLQPSMVIAVTRSRRDLMRQVSALGMSGSTTRISDSGWKAASKSLRSRDREHVQELLHQSNANGLFEAACDPVEDDNHSETLQPSVIITVTRSRRNIMRQISALGMGRVAAGKHGETAKVAPTHLSSRHQNKICVHAALEGRQVLSSINSDLAVEPGSACDTNQHG